MKKYQILFKSGHTLIITTHSKTDMVDLFRKCVIEKSVTIHCIGDLDDSNICLRVEDISYIISLPLNSYDK